MHIYIYMYVYIAFYYPFSVKKHLGCLHFLANVNRAAMKMFEMVSL